MRTRQVRPDKLDFEYELYISKEHDETKKRDYILFEFRTKKEFENFAYQINVIPKIDLEKNEIEFNLEGLSAPRLDISRAGNAVYKFSFYDFKNKEYDLKLLKYAKGKIIYKLKINPKSIKITKEPKSSFLKIITEEN
ncbi:MAG: hypothetical protein LH629_12050 [Ignavibacteria bacterium]|nr:hypothetical protein [Ignavibacteria bacterium]